MAELTPTSSHPTTGPCDAAKLTLSYRLPGSTTTETQETTVSYDTDAVPATGYYSSKDIEKNTIILGLYRASPRRDGDGPDGSAGSPQAS